MKKTGVFFVSCSDTPRGYYYDAFYNGTWLGSFDYHFDALNEVSNEERKQKNV